MQIVYLKHYNISKQYVLLVHIRIEVFHLSSFNCDLSWIYRRAGAGEYGEEVILDDSLKPAVDKAIAEFGFNLVASDRVSLDRAPKDLRKLEYVKNFICT